MPNPNENKFPEENGADKNKEPKVYEVPAAGSLGLLALGYRGLELWRKKRQEESHNKDEQKKS